MSPENHTIGEQVYANDSQNGDEVILRCKRRR
jgi:hypothetical protein